MIDVVFAPGCYGSYVMQCVYAYSELGCDQTVKMNKKTGDSHDFRNSIACKENFKFYHLNNTSNLDQINSNKSICIRPVIEHRLDYFNNQFLKQYNKDLVLYMKEIYPMDVIKSKLKNFWNYTGNFDENVPRWILREWFSIWIEDCWNNGYNIEKYKSVKTTIAISTTDLFDVHTHIFKNVISALGLTYTADEKIVKNNTSNFIKLQQYHNSQKRIKQWVNSIITESDTIDNPCVTIFDEAYAQKLLKDNDIELLCNELNIFPSTSEEMMKKIVRKQEK